MPPAELRAIEGSPRAKVVLTALCLGGYFFIGCLAALFPSIMPAVIRGFGLNLAAAGLIFPASSVGSLTGGLLTGIWADRVGRKPFFCGSALLSGACLMVASAVHRWPLFVGCCLLLGIAQGALSNSINALVLDVDALRRGRALNRLHGVYSLGATVSPYLILWALGPAMSWRPVLFVAAGVWMALSVAALGFRYPAAGAAATRRTFQRALLRNSLFAMLFAVAFIYNGVAWALLGWVKVSLQGVGAHPQFASGMISVFYLGLTVGRFACAFLSERLRYGKTLLLCALGTTLAYPLATFGAHALWIAAGVFLSGLFLSGLYPTALAYATRLFPALSGTVAGTLAVAMTLGAALPPWWTGLIGGARGVSFALRFNYLLVLPLVGIALYLLRREPDSAGLPAAREELSARPSFPCPLRSRSKP